MTYDLRYASWIPWRRRSGTVEWGPPWLLTDGLRDDPIVAIATPRPDFDGALQEFLIGLLGVAMQVADEAEWEARWHEPPTPDVLRQRLDALPNAFALDGDGPRAFQFLEMDDLRAVKPLPVEDLLVESKVSSLFVKSGRVERLGRPAAAMALITLQTYAPPGGSGIFASMRGGGPLTTLVEPRVDVRGHSLAHERPLWEKLWANVETIWQAAERSPTTHNAAHDVFHWLCANRERVELTESQASPWQAYFGLPRRVRLDFDGPGRCDLTGLHDDVTVSVFRMRPRGVRYPGWRHPLSPHYQSAQKEWLPVHGQPDGIGWRDWIGLTIGRPDGKREPARAVAAFNDRGARIGLREVRLHAFGFDTDQAKARGWLDANQPVFVTPDDVHTSGVRDAAARLTEAASIAASLLVATIKRALFERASEVRGDFSVVTAELWNATEQAFFDALRSIASATDADRVTAAADEHCRSFARHLSREALAIFDRWCPGDATAPELMRRTVVARYNLARALGGWTKTGEDLFKALRIPLPGGGRAARKRAARKSSEVTT